MHSYQDLLAGRKEDGNVWFFLYLMRVAILEFREPILEDYDDKLLRNIAKRIVSYNVPENLCQIDDSEEIREIFSSPFDVPITECRDFFIYYFSFLSKIMILVDEPRSRRNVKNIGFFPPRRPGEHVFDTERYVNQAGRGLYVEPEPGLDIPISYDYFKKIVVGSEIGEWKYMEYSGNVVTFKPPLQIDVVTKEDQIPPVVRHVSSSREIADIAKRLNRPELTRYDGFCVYEDPPGNLMLLNDIPPPHTPDSIHKLIIAKRLANISQQKEKYSILANNMKVQGYPYVATYDEYIRFLKTNLRNMNFGGYTLKTKLIFDMFVPSSLRN